MTTPLEDLAKVALARRAIACAAISAATGKPKWKWMPGMRPIDDDDVLCIEVGPAGEPIAWIHEGDVVYDEDLPGEDDHPTLPDFDHPPTLGGLRHRVQLAYGHGPERDVSIERTHNGMYSLAVKVAKDGAWVYDGSVHGGWLARMTTRGLVQTGVDGWTEVEALVLALEAAP